MRGYLSSFGMHQGTGTAEDYLVSRIGRDLFHKIYEQYIVKQWDREARELNVSVVKRLPIRFGNDDRYFTDRYQGIPKYGYHSMFNNMLANDRITVVLNTEYESIADSIDFEHLFYTGPIDLFHGHVHGCLQYRGINFVSETLPRQSYNAPPITVYPGCYDFTRVTDYGQLTGQGGTHGISVGVVVGPVRAVGLVQW